MDSPKIENLIKENDFIRRAYEFAKQAHAGQNRVSGEPYFNHALATAQTVAQWGLDQTTIASAFLHDVVEDTNYPLEKIKSEFGDEVAFIVDAISKLGKIKYRGVEQQIENLHKMILASSQDIRVILVKLADRLHNMRTLSALPANKQKRIALETMDIYSPIAYKLGMQKISGELEDLAFPYVYPREYHWLVNNVKEKYEEREFYVEQVKPILADLLQKEGVDYIAITSRAKRYYSLYKKLLRYDMDIEKIYDLVALRVIVKTIEDCYAVLGIVHNTWPPLPNRIKDYIALPKPNGYRSLHTTVFCTDDKIIEIQIRTQQMHDEAETGIAAQWVYEKAKKAGLRDENQIFPAHKKELQWVEQLREWQKEFTTPEEFMESFKISLFRDRIFAISPRGEVFGLPSGATPVDFAYQIHSDIGNSCSGAKVNGKLVQLNHELKSGDLVEIIIQKNKKPSESWLQFVKTANAKNHIRAALKQKSSLVKREPKSIEMELGVNDKIGLLKDISAVISRSHINISSINTIPAGKIPLIKIVCSVTTKDKIEKLLTKLKKIKNVKTINYRLL